MSHFLLRQKSRALFSATGSDELGCGETATNAVEVDGVIRALSFASMHPR
jgi:hypothetical protein